MSNESENKLARRADDKRADRAVDWTDAPRFTALGIAETWSVTVEAEGQRVVSISDEHVAGLDGERLDQFVPTIRSCAQHLLGFIGAAPTSSTAGAEKGGEPYKKMLESELKQVLLNAAIHPNEPYVHAAARAIEAEVARRCRAQGGITSLKGLQRYAPSRKNLGAMVRDDDGRYFDSKDVERLLATTAGEQAEPAAWKVGSQLFSSRDAIPFNLLPPLAHPVPLYQAAPAAPEQVQGLTNERIIEIADTTRTAESRDGDYILPISFARAIEAEVRAAAPSAAAPAAPTLTDEEITDAVFGIYLSGFDDAKKYDIAIVRAALAALAKKSPAAPAAEEVRDEALLEAMAICDQKYEARVRSGHPREASTARALSEEINAIRAMKRAASTEGGAT